MKIETLAVHAGHAVDPATGAVATPIYLSTTFERDVEGTYSRGFMYTRNDNPNRQALERGVSMLEGGAAAAAFASGTGATMSIFQALAAVAQIVHGAGAICVCDNTWAPVLQRPFDLGADLILHSTTKYFGGHCDVLGGIVVARIENDFFQRLCSIQYEGGAVPSPFDCWLILRGMRTLPWRMRAHSENAMKIADFLASHSRVGRVHYPGLRSHPAHKIAAKQMSMFGGMLSFEVKD